MPDIHGIIKVIIVAAATQYSVVLPASTRRIKITPESGQTCYVSFTTGQVATYGGFAVRASSPVDTKQRAAQATTVYLASAMAGSTVFIEFWAY